MTLNEKKGLLTYLDDQLMTMCRQMTTQLDTDQIGLLYDKCYDLIHDIENTLQGAVDVSSCMKSGASKIKR